MNTRDPLPPLSPEEAGSIGAFAARTWDDEIVPALMRYIAVPAKSPMFDPDWREHGYIDRVVADAAGWVESRRLAGLKLEVVRLEGRTPAIFFELPATKPGGNDAGADTVLLYGHLDKQPEFTGWRSDLGPWQPKLDGGRLYGRGGADDGYAIYAAVTALEALDRQGLPRPRCVGLIETCEESGSFDLPAIIDALGPRLGNVSLVVCLDSGAGNYDQLWLTSSLRGVVSGVLRVEILTEGVHSGDAGGVVPSSFRILRHVLDRLEDSATGRLLPAALHCEIPADRVRQAQAAARILGDRVWKNYPWACGADGRPALPTGDDPVELLLDRTWRPSLAVVGAEGFPEVRSAGNVLQAVFGLQAGAAPAADGRRRRRRAAAEDAARGQRAVRRPRHLRRRCARRSGRRRRRQGGAVGRLGLERAGARALARTRARRCLGDAFRRPAGAYRPGRHDPADGAAAAGLPARADDGLRRARPAQQRPRAERVPACAVRQEAHRRGGAGDRGASLKIARRRPAA